MIPVYINVFNRLTTTRKLVEQVKQLDNAQPVVIDNASQYEPLLEWYDTNPCDIVRLHSNLGHHSPWLSGVIRQDGAAQYVVTDCDLDLDGVPSDVLMVLESAFNWSGRKPLKSGLALRIDDLPSWQSAVTEWESRWWRAVARHSPPFWWANIDTTFALYKAATPNRLAMSVVGASAVRLGGDYQARHTPWYLDCENLDEENAHYFATANVSNSWKPHGKALAAAYTGASSNASRRA